LSITEACFVSIFVKKNYEKKIKKKAFCADYNILVVNREELTSNMKIALFGYLYVKNLEKSKVGA
jgi:hypothetical protein